MMLFIIISLYLQGFFGSLREEYIMKGKKISITICTLGLIGTENVIRALDEFKPGMLSKFPDPPSPSEAALEVIKGGAQRWKEVYYTKMEKFVFVDLYFIMPETIAALGRYLWS